MEGAGVSCGRQITLFGIRDMLQIKRLFSALIYGSKSTFVIRIIFGAMFLISGFNKSTDLYSFGRTVIRYNILPEIFVPYAAITIPFLEILLGLLLIAGFRVKSSSFLSMTLLALFTFFIAVNVIRGETFDCGCFNLKIFGLGIDERIGWKLILRNAVILLFFALIYKTERHLYSIDNYLEKLDLENIDD